MKTLKYSVEVRDLNNKFYRDSEGNATRFTFEEEEVSESLTELVCRKEHEKYKAICKEGSIIDIEVRYFNNLTNSYPVLYSFYGAENKFVKHS